MPQKGIVDPNLEALIQHIAKKKAEAFEKRTKNDAVPWSRPPLDEWDGDLQSEQALINVKSISTIAQRCLMQ